MSTNFSHSVLCPILEVIDIVFKPHSTGICCTFFCERVVNVWNNLPMDVNFSSLNTFKHSINYVDFSRFLLRNFSESFCVSCFYVLLF